MRVRLPWQSRKSATAPDRAPARPAPDGGGRTTPRAPQGLDAVDRVAPRDANPCAWQVMDRLPTRDGGKR
jgi:hypothetical protein